MIHNPENVFLPVWSNKLILAAASELIRTIFSELSDESSNSSCLILPELSKMEFSNFQRILLTNPEDLASKEIDWIALIRVAQILGAELVRQISKNLEKTYIVFGRLKHGLYLVNS